MKVDKSYTVSDKSSKNGFKMANREFKGFLPSEDEIHISIARYLNLKKHNGKPLFWWHTPNGGKMKKSRGAKLKSMGVRAGVSDIFIAEPVGDYHGIFIELKKPKGVVSANQKVFLSDAKDRGYATAVCYSLDQVVKVVNEYLKGGYVG